MRFAAALSRAMPTVFFDIHRETGTTFDEEGIELPYTGAARELALDLLGQAILDGARRPAGGMIKIEVRDRSGPFLRVSAVVMFEKLRRTGADSN
ncbi:hypothetical protein [Bradyrhizobium sp. B117]|uniref:DUF6894 family protein n=1 Tax=Bradyrhizobium sp. B117 TaxID=3140246 RepID=UPI0031839AE8